MSTAAQNHHFFIHPYIWEILYTATKLCIIVHKLLACIMIFKKMCTAPENQIIEWCIEWMSFTNFVVSLFFISSSSPNVIYLCANIFLSVYEENIWINSESAKSKKFAIRISFDILLYRALFIGKENKYLLILREIIKLDGGWHGGRIIYHFSHYITKMNDDTILV